MSPDQYLVSLRVNPKKIYDYMQLVECLAYSFDFKLYPDKLDDIVLDIKQDVSPFIFTGDLEQCNYLKNKLQKWDFSFEIIKCP